MDNEFNYRPPAEYPGYCVGKYVDLSGHFAERTAGVIKEVVLDTDPLTTLILINDEGKEQRVSIRRSWL